MPRPRKSLSKTYADLGPDDVTKIGEVFVLTGSYTEAAKAVGCTPTLAHWAIRRLSTSLRESVLVRLLDDAAMRAADEVGKNLDALAAARKTAKTVSEKAVVASAINDTAKTVSTMRTAEAKMRGTHAPAAVSLDARITSLSDEELDLEVTRLLKKSLEGGEG